MPSQVRDGYRNAEGEKEQLGFNAFFLPTYGGEASTMPSTFPALTNPMLALSAYHGDLGVDAGFAKSIYQLDTKNLKGSRTPTASCSRSSSRSARP
ncbi:cytochrome c biogenesis protein ResB [Streptomyces thinghirensis]|nr:cytochrome c biogenesis protein ResB [Streptomyces thinghirensis]